LSDATLINAAVTGNEGVQYRFFNDKKTQTEAAVLLGVKVRVIAQIRTRNLEAKRITMASWRGLPSSADAGRRASPCGAPTDC
jgi:hypothetical protein